MHLQAFMTLSHLQENIGFCKKGNGSGKSGLCIFMDAELQDGPLPVGFQYSFYPCDVCGGYVICRACLGTLLVLDTT